jgi:hypothetical protein
VLCRPGADLPFRPRGCTLKYLKAETDPVPLVPFMPLPTRREFVSSTAALFGGGWLWLQLPALASLSACARDAARRNDPFTTLSPGEGHVMRAFAARIIPSGDGIPGAEEAGAAWFVDGALSNGPFASLREMMSEALGDLDTRSMTAHGVAFADAAPEQQDALMHEIEESQFFFIARMLTLAGTFSDPVHGGNRDHAGFALLQMEHAAAYQPPFGWYDRQYAGSSDADGAGAQ